MSIFEETIHILQKDSRIEAFFQAISPGDLSVMEAMLDREDSVGLTSQGSPNDQLWSCLAEYRWMTARGADEAPNLPVESRRYSLTEAGRRAIPVILARMT